MSQTKTTKPILATKGDDSDLARRFGDLYLDAQSGLRRVVAFGLYAFQIKLHHLRHGQFIAWCQQHFPDLSRQSIQAYMQLTESAMKHAGIKSIKRFIQNQMTSTLVICHSGDFLVLPDAEVPDPLKPLREKVFSIIDGKSARQMFMEFKQAEDDGEGIAKPKRGRLKGQGGATKEQRAAAQATEEKARILELELSAKEFGKWMDEVSDARGLGTISDKAFLAYFERLEAHWAFCRSLKSSRKGGAQ
jgi:hypothetical protein